MNTKFDAKSEALSTAEFLNICRQRSQMFFLMLRPRNLYINSEESLFIFRITLATMMGMHAFVNHLYNIDGSDI